MNCIIFFLPMDYDIYFYILVIFAFIRELSISIQVCASKKGWDENCETWIEKDKLLGKI